MGKNYAKRILLDLEGELLYLEGGLLDLKLLPSLLKNGGPKVSLVPRVPTFLTKYSRKSCTIQALLKDLDQS